VSAWQEEKAERNRQALARLFKRLPNIYPRAVLARALNRAREIERSPTLFATARYLNKVIFDCFDRL